MNIEILPNELVFKLFEYLHIADQFQAFYNLNSRFNQLLSSHLKTHNCLNLFSVSKTNFDVICRNYLPQFLDRPISIHLFDNAQQINQFLSYGYHFHQFIFLKFLSLNYVDSASSLQLVIDELQHLKSFTHLLIKQCDIEDVLINNGRIFDQIWTLSTLTHFVFERKKYLWNPFFISPKRISTSIKYVCLDGFSYNSDELHRLLEHTINLESLNIEIEHNYDYQSISSAISSLKKFKLSVHYSSHITHHLLHYTPNLTHLTIKLFYIILDGYQWEKLITTYLSNLKVFHFKMQCVRRCNNTTIESIDELIDSFRSPFWLDEHQWFIQCHLHRSDKRLLAHLYTLPYHFNEFNMNSTLQFRTTCPANEVRWSYDNVKHLTYQGSNCSSIRFPNVENLIVVFPIDMYFQLNLPNLYRLTSMTVKSIETAHDERQFENLLRYTINLRSLAFKESSLSCEVLYRLANSSIRQLDLHCLRYFNEEQCKKLASSTLGIQCERLSISVCTRTDILLLVNQMKKLQMLNAHCKDDDWDQKIYESNSSDKFVCFLKEQLPNTCTIQRCTGEKTISVQL
ncbi:unnamed protein product [Adineta ricciae]|uniref:F-box domain-containing protein n=1 Tax=Adineta ricciae TaxID=249248 RepID=A0A815BS31_ADIRI|nr:unnamed protein product [Adineta ricciae]